MKFKTVVLAIATVLTLAQSAEANECKIFEIVRHTGNDVVANLRRTVIKQVSDGYDAPKSLEEKIKRYNAVLEYNELYQNRVGCGDYTLNHNKITRAEKAVGEETLIRLDQMLHN